MTDHKLRKEAARAEAEIVALLREADNYADFAGGVEHMSTLGRSSYLLAQEVRRLHNLNRQVVADYNDLLGTMLMRRVR